MIESFTMWRVKDKEFSDYEEAVRYDSVMRNTENHIDFFDSQGNPLIFEEDPERTLETADFIHLKNEESLIYIKECFDELGLLDCPETIGWNRFDITDYEWKSFTEEKNAFEKNWGKVRERIKEE